MTESFKFFSHKLSIYIAFKQRLPICFVGLIILEASYEKNRLGNQTKIRLRVYFFPVIKAVIMVSSAASRKV